MALPAPEKPSEYAVAVIAETRGLDREMVRQDLELLAHYVRHPCDAVDDLFCVGDGWLYDPLVEYQRTVVERFFLGPQKVCEIMPRGHAKTTIGGRICVILSAVLLLDRYTVVASATADNAGGNIEAMEAALTDERFAKLQWLATYLHGNNIADKRAGNEFHFAGGSLTEYRSFQGEMRGMNRAPYGGRPTRFVGDDIIPTEAATSKAVRDSITRRFFAMVRPIGGVTQSGSRTKFTVYGTIHHKDDILNKMAEGRITGYDCTPKKYRAVEVDGKFLWPAIWNQDELDKVRAEYESEGLGYLFRHEFYNDPQGPASHPLFGWGINTYDPQTVIPTLLHRVIAVDSSHGIGKDAFTIVELGMDSIGRIFVLNLVTEKHISVKDRKERIKRLLRSRKPHEMAIEWNTDSITFIQDLQDEIAQESATSIKIQTPTAASRGRKNYFILGRLEPMKDNGTLYALPEHKRTIEEQANAWSFDDENNEDDVLDVIASGSRYLRKPEPLQRPERELEKLVSDIRDRNQYEDY